LFFSLFIIFLMNHPLPYSLRFLILLRSGLLALFFFDAAAVVAPDTIGSFPLTS
ncbi:hypothetical protein A2U01_0067522, partial [Trifolium medium]|nr:hypothetical protein [Trifolium medium]